eukprot:9477618-Pyramimonas_sp.AAC.2
MWPGACVSHLHARGVAGHQPVRRGHRNHLRPRLQSARGPPGGGARTPPRAAEGRGGVPAGDRQQHRGAGGGAGAPQAGAREVRHPGQELRRARLGG